MWHNGDALSPYRSMDTAAYCMYAKEHCAGAYFTYDVTLTPRVPFQRAARWCWDHDEPLTVAVAGMVHGASGGSVQRHACMVPAGGRVSVTLGPGESAHVHFVCGV